MPVSPQVADALNAQLGRELEAHLQYLAISSHFSAEALPELTRFFARQAAEEHDHAMRFLRFLQDSGAHVAIPALAAPRDRFESAEEAVALSLEWEEDVTRYIGDLVETARSAGDHATFSFLQWFVDEQVEEVSTMSDLLTIVRRAGEAGLLDVETLIARGSLGDHGEEE
jgi:ferritin